MDDSKVVPIREKNIGLRLRVNARYQDNQGIQVPFVTEMWVRKENVLEILRPHMAASNVQTLIYMQGGKVIESHDLFDSVVRRLESGVDT